MATRTLNDGAKNLTTAGNWSGATAPVNGDVVIIPRGSQHINVFALSGVSLDGLQIAFNGTIETDAGAAFAIDVDNAGDDATATITGAGARLKLAAGSTSGIWNITKINSPDSRITFQSIRHQDYQQESGTVIMDATARVDKIRMYGGHLTLNPNSNVVGDAEILGGHCVIRRGGTFIVSDNASVEIDVQSGAALTVNQLSTRTTLYHINGAFDGELKAGNYIDRLETPATIGGGGAGVVIGPNMKINATSRVTWSSVVSEGVNDAGGPQIG